ncbi:VWA domain-containing protein [Polyangium spumosum]|uniref:VWA domain-containing protein n=1 Tax=Polyangium spumosum TaxID=889282 RepID=A0A6N7PR24_9BACT|nr:VWA domain-containing protein [Polyangium spumosum]MRG92675.1 VWA domain-containing protein [Polyangium spumosum]
MDTRALRSARGIAATSILLGAFGITSALGGCGSSGDDKLPPRPPMLAPDAGGEGGFDGGGAGPPAPDAGGYCGNEVHQAVVDAPNLYFVLDASGSMQAPAPGGLTRYNAVRVAVVDLVRKLGPLVKVGAAILPNQGSNQDQCAAGKQVFPVTQGDPITGEDGPTTTGIRIATATNPVGGTPISPTIEALTPMLLGLEGKTYVILATDGGPNCNESAACGADACEPNLAGDEACLATGTNCCAPGQLWGPTFCVDEPASVAAIEALRAGGVEVFVVGIPGSEAYAGVLDAMAIAGGSKKDAAPFYEPVTELGSLGSVLGEIAAVAVTCEFAIVDPPSEEDMTNVYLDDEVLPYNDPDGWAWKPPWIVRLLGEACERLQGGQVKQVQIVSGCPTELPK